MIFFIIHCSKAEWWMTFCSIHKTISVLLFFFFFSFFFKGAMRGTIEENKIMTKEGNQACILCSAVLALISCLQCRAEVCTIHLLRNSTVELFQLEHKCANEKLEISLPAFMQKVFLHAQVLSTVERLSKTDCTLFLLCWHLSFL